MRIALTGATGLVGDMIAADLLTAGHRVTTLGRRPSHRGLPHLDWRLDGPAPDLGGQDVLVHAAFSHVPGRYRGGEGDDPEGFVARNGAGTARLVTAMPGRVIFLSSRAVYGAYPPGTALDETMAPRPDTLYGEVKLAAERALRPSDVALRATGVFGPAPPGRDHKWADLFAAYDRGETVVARAGTEVSGPDLAAAIRLVLTGDVPEVVNVSDLILDRRDLLAAYGRLTGRDGLLPDRADPGQVNAMTTDRLRTLGWQPGGMAGLERILARMVA